MPVAPHLKQIMRQADQTPFATDVRQATQQEAAEPPRFFDLAGGVLKVEVAIYTARPKA